MSIKGLLLAWAFIVLPVSCFSFSLPENCTHSSHSRGCWGDGFNIQTDYTDVSKIPPGKLVEYHLTLSEQIVSPDGYMRPGIVINGQFPGPTIEADWGDTLRITVDNNLTTYNGTTIHWHAIRQWQTNWQDGVPGVTQCPIEPGGRHVYEFRATQYGTTWYHSHDSMQISDGLYGALVIHGPSSMNYDIDLGPWLLGDWYHTNISGLDWIPRYFENDTLPPITLLNGKGYLNCSGMDDQADNSPDTHCTGSDNHFEVLFQKGKKYKIGIIGSTTLLAYDFWIDGHNMTVIEADLVPIQPFVTNLLTITSGQRYEIIVEASAEFDLGTNFWIHANPCNPRAQKPHKLGVIRYNKQDTRDPQWSPFSEIYHPADCYDVDISKLVPIIKKKVGKHVNGLTPDDYLIVGKEAYPDVSQGKNSHFFKWVLKNKPQAVDWNNPTLKQLSTGDDAQILPEAVPVYLDFETDEWVHFLILSNSTETSLVMSPSYHPMHLHGHDFSILAQGSGIFNEWDVIPNLEDPPRRDTVTLPSKTGYLWIAFQINNPGAWLLHCHIASHSLAGLSLQFIEQPRKIRGLMEGARAVGELQERCEAWYNWAKARNFSLGNTSGL